MRNRPSMVLPSMLVLIVVLLVSVFSLKPHQAAAYGIDVPGEQAAPPLMLVEQGPLCVPEAIRIGYDYGRQSTCFVKTARVQLPYVAHIFSGKYAGFVTDERGERIAFCPWKMYSVYIPMVTQVTITGTRCAG